ncbi:DUF5304 family protein [Peterkaempfera bronchialis]|uniref:DUF5304 family protein n=1 Tax=Peterkaempfera bronchialis TaxID=2126346 RepID=UPI003C2DA6EA
MTSADDRREDDDIWAQAVAEDAEAQERLKQQGEQQQGEQRQGEQEPQAADADPFGGGTVGDGAVGGGGVGDGEKAFPFGVGGPELAPLVDEVRRFASAVGERMQEVSRTLGAGEGLEQLASPLRERHPEVYRHLAAAGGELLAAYRAAVSGQERRWTGEKPSDSEHIDLD